MRSGDAFVTFHNLTSAPAEAVTFEAWVRTCDECVDSTFLSYSSPPGDRVDLAILSSRQVKACRDFQDPAECTALYAKWTTYSQRAERAFTNNLWNHIAVVWNAAVNGTAKVYKNGLLVSAVPTGKTAALPTGGVWTLGGLQGRSGLESMYSGVIDSVRLWNVERSQQQILDNMYESSRIIAAERGLVGAWDFDEPLTSALAGVCVATTDL